MIKMAWFKEAFSELIASVSKAAEGPEGSGDLRLVGRFRSQHSQLGSCGGAWFKNRHSVGGTLQFVHLHALRKDGFVLFLFDQTQSIFCVVQTEHLSIGRDVSIQ